MLKEQIDKLIANAMFAKDEKRLGVLRMVKSAMLVLEKSGAEYNKTSELKMLLKMKAAMEDSIAQFTAGGRADLADNEKAGLEILNEFLPKEASEDDIKAYVNEVIDGLGHDVSMKDMKTILSAVQAKYPTSNGKVVSEVVKSRM